jgi:hypothetical protein
VKNGVVAQPPQHIITAPQAAWTPAAAPAAQISAWRPLPSVCCRLCSLLLLLLLLVLLVLPPLLQPLRPLLLLQPDPVLQPLLLLMTHPI